MGDLADRLERADLVVGVHDADDRGTLGEGAAHRIGIYEPVAIDRQDRHAAPQPAQKVTRLKRCRVLNGARDDVRRRDGAEEAAEHTLQPGEDITLWGVIARFGADA